MNLALLTPDPVLLLLSHIASLFGACFHTVLSHQNLTESSEKHLPTGQSSLGDAAASRPREGQKGGCYIILQENGLSLCGGVGGEDTIVVDRLDDSRVL